MPIDDCTCWVLVLMPVLLLCLLTASCRGSMAPARWAKQGVALLVLLQAVISGECPHTVQQVLRAR